MVSRETMRAFSQDSAFSRSQGIIASARATISASLGIWVSMLLMFLILSLRCTRGG